MQPLSCDFDIPKGMLSKMHQTGLDIINEASAHFGSNKHSSKDEHLNNVNNDLNGWQLSAHTGIIKKLQGSIRRISSYSEKHRNYKTVEIKCVPGEPLGIFIKKRRLSKKTQAMLGSKDGIFVTRIDLRQHRVEGQPAATRRSNPDDEHNGGELLQRQTGGRRHVSDELSGAERSYQECSQ